MIKPIIYAAAALLILQIGLAAAVHLKDTTNLESTAPDSAFLSFTPDAITSIIINGAEDKELLLQKTDKGWVMPGAFSAPAEKSQAENLLQKLAETRQGLAVATSKGAAERFKTAEDKFERHIVLKQGDSVAADFYLGTSAGFRHTHARIAGQVAVVSIPVGSHEVEPDADSWLDRSLADLNRDEIKAVVLGEISLTATEQDKKMIWLLDGTAAEDTENEEVDKLLDKITGISVQSVLDPEKSAALFKQEPAVRFTVTKQDDSRVVYAFVKEDDRYVLKMSDNDLYFKVGSWQIEGLSEMKREKLLVGYKEKKEEQAAAQEAPQLDTSDRTDDVIPEQEEEQVVLPEIPAEEQTGMQQEADVGVVQDNEAAEQQATQESAIEEPSAEAGAAAQEASVDAAAVNETADQAAPSEEAASE